MNKNTKESPQPSGEQRYFKAVKGAKAFYEAEESFDNGEDRFVEIHNKSQKRGSQEIYYAEEIDFTPSPAVDHTKITKELVRHIFGEEAANDSDIVNLYADVNKDALDSIKLPAVSEGREKELWERFSFTSESSDEDFTVRLMTKPQFELLLKELTKSE